ARQRDRPRRVEADRRLRRLRRAGRRDRRARLRGGHVARRRRPRLRPLLAGGSLAAAHDGRHGPRARDRHRGRDRPRRRARGVVGAGAGQLLPADAPAQPRRRARGPLPPAAPARPGGGGDMRRRMRALLGGVLGAALVLAGCAGIPTDGSVGTFTIGEDGSDDRLLTLADGPQEGQTPAEILAGFLAAQRAPQNNYSIARLFLSDEFRAEWSPTSLVRVTDSPMSPEPNGGDDRLRIAATVQATVDETGVYKELRPAEPQALDYEFALNDEGEWRISAAPQGTVLSNRGFERSFVAYPLYFFDPSGTALVP